MSENLSENSEKVSAMSDVTAENVRARMRDLVREAALPAQVGESVKAVLRRASRRLDMPVGRVKRHWYGEARQVPAHEFINAQQKIEARRQAEARRLREQLKAMESSYAAERAAFIDEAPAALARLVPPAVDPMEGESE